ncbi:MAG: pectate lyase [Bacteroidales bacterium]|nr:pectate lyase [Bacteroidales bacterium]
MKLHSDRFLPLILGAFLILAGCGQDEPVVLPEDLDAPSGVRLVSSDGTSLVFSWDEVKDAEYYVARLETSAGDLVPGGQTTTKETTIGFSGLQADAAYKFKVRVRAGGVDSPFSEPLDAVTTENEGPGPGPGTTPKPEPSESYAEFKIPAVEDEHMLPLAFPGAEGGGMYTTGGRDGKVIHVTTLADSGSGSLRAALSESGPRTIVFDVAGVIELKSTLNIKNGDVTIAGQTAPGDGICLKNYSTVINADNVVIRFVRFRMGDEAKQENDAIWGRYHRNIILDHCSMSWSTDECSSFYANEFFTMQWCILTESLRNSVHGKGKHGYGGIWGGKNASFHHNLLSCHDSRNPRIDHPQIYGDYVTTHRGNVDYRCNAVYNWGSNHTYGGEDGWFNIVNNYYKPGPASSDRKYFVDAYGSYVKDGVTYADSYAEMYLSGNVHEKYPELGAANDASTIYWHNGSSYGNYNLTLSSPLMLEGPAGGDIYTTTHSAADAFARICEVGGASLSRDSVDERACSDAKNGTATVTDGGNGSKNGIIDTQTAAGGWPSYEASADELSKVKDTDGDGMPDWFEDKYSLDASKADDGNKKNLDSYGRYTNLEMYLHYLVRDIVDAQNAGGRYVNLQ